ncbi:hypothetical protein ACCS68_04275 [Rhizobium beringeri]|uniref:hypothetical protein n=1 Tax=Rhizobium beringeri TaxID=3019934 RepID=UPI003CEFF48C
MAKTVVDPHDEGKMGNLSKMLLTISVVAQLSSCGAIVPDMAPVGQTVLQETFREIDLVNHIKCEIHLGTREALKVWKKGGEAGGNGVEWLRDWQAKISLKLTVEDTGGFNPAIAVVDPMHNVITAFSRGGNVTSAQSFTMGLGMNSSTQATRAETVAFTFNLSDLLENDPLPEEATNCEGHGKVPVLGSLKINDFIVSKAGMAASPDTVPNDGKISPFTVFSDQVTFIVTLSGNVNPQWKLVNFSGQTGNNQLLTAMRKRTQDVTITMGPKNSQEVVAVYTANLTGQAVAAALQSQR